MTTIELVSGIICLKYGDKVSDQFIDVYENNEPLEEQNRNALRYILEVLKEVLEYELIVEDWIIDDIVTELKEFLNE